MLKKSVHTYSNDRNEIFEGFVAYDDRWSGKRPVVIIAHAFGGLSSFEEDRAVALAHLGYLGFAIDLYGKGRRASSSAEAVQLMNELDHHRDLLLERVQLGLREAARLQNANSEKIGAIGYCFGGKCVLDLARSGARLSGVVSFHGVYDAPEKKAATTVACPVLILHGWDDPLSPPAAVSTLAAELSESGVSWELVAYGNTGHGFTNPSANQPKAGIDYQKESAEKAWERMTCFWQHQFSGK